MQRGAAVFVAGTPAGLSGRFRPGDGANDRRDGEWLGVDYDWGFIERNRTAHPVCKWRNDAR